MRRGGMGMKKICGFIALTVVSMLFAFTEKTAAQEARIVHYDTSANASSKRPDFKGAVIAIDFGGTAALNAKTLFVKLGATDFVEGKNPCVIAHTVVCVRFSEGESVQSSSYGGISNYGGHGGYSSNGSFSGTLTPISLTVFLVVYDPNDGGNRPTIMLGQASALAPAGSGSEWSSSYGRGAAGTYYSGGTSDLGATIGTAVNQDLNALLSKNLFNKFLAWGTYAKWVPGADATVKDTFAN